MTAIFQPQLFIFLKYGRHIRDSAGYVIIYDTSNEILNQQFCSVTFNINSNCDMVYYNAVVETLI